MSDTAEFLVIFRAGSRTLTADEQQRRQAAAAAWAVPLRARGDLVQVILTGAGGTQVASDGTTAPVDTTDAIAAVSLIRAASLADAVATVADHPGLAYGTTVEVRPVRPLPVPA